MRDCLNFFIDGEWVASGGANLLDVENPATETTCGRIALATDADIDRAVAAARRAFPAWSASSREERLDLLGAILTEYQRRAGDLADAVREEMGAPAGLARGAQVPLGLAHLNNAIEIRRTYAFEERRGPTLIRREPVGVCGMITPWNWPLNQIACKVFPALATGNTMVLKPSEIAPFSAVIFAEIMQAAGTPAGVFNLVQGDGPGAGTAMSGHPGIDMVSFTGSTRAGVAIARNAADTVKRVSQELGGKSPNLILDDGAFAAHVGKGVAAVMGNSGQTCAAPTRMLVPSARMDEAAAIARDAAEAVVVGDPSGNVRMGPVVSGAQFAKIQRLIEAGIAEGAQLVAGGPGRPEGLERGWFVKPTVFADVRNDMTIAREEIFGPVLSIIGYADLDDAVRIANDTPYGLSAYVNGEDADLARSLARRIRAGQVCVNGASDMTAPFGGFGQSGNGREWGPFGFDEFCEIKAIIG